MSKPKIVSKSSNTEKSCIIVSYVPLLMGNPGEDLSQLSSKELQKRLTAIETEIQINACLWAGPDPPKPVFIINKAQQVVDHLKSWAEDKLEDWFELNFVEMEDFYGVILWPDLNRSLERFKTAWLHRNEELLAPQSCQFIFRPLCFRSKNKTTFNLVKEKISRTAEIGFLDVTLFDPAHLDKCPDPLWVGPLKVNFKNETVRIWFEQNEKR